MTTVVLGYWKIRGLAQFIRHLLAYTGIEFTEVQYQAPEKWFGDDKKNLGLEFPNLPYLIDGDFKLTESAAIAKYIINKSGKTELLGKDVHDEGKVNNLIGVFTDALKSIRELFGNKDYETLKLESLEKARTKLDFLKDFIGEKPFAIGYLTLVDFIFAEILYYFESLYPNERKNYAFWWRIRQNVEKLPGVQAYYQRPDAISQPFLPAAAALTVKPKKVKFGYWNIRGIAQTQRLLLAYSGVEFQDITYTDREKWFNGDKANLGLDFPNVPYLIDGNYSITQSAAIQRYIIKRWGKNQLLGKNVQDNAKIESFLSIFTEIAAAAKVLFFNKDYQTAKVPVLEKYTAKLAQLNEFVGEKGFVLGYLTLADFVVAEESHFIEALYPEEYKTWPFLQRVRQSFDKLPEIISYYEKPTAFKGRFYPEVAFLSVEK